MRLAELGTVYRYERSGTMHGLMRVRGFTQDDGHVFCLPEQLEHEIVLVLNLIQEVLGYFGFVEFEILLSTKPSHSVGSEELWDAAKTALSGALDSKQMQYEIDEGGGAFYGPKIDIKIKDAIGRKWQCSTIQCDFNLPSRFKLEYTASDGSRKTPVMIHRAIFGSIERFFGVLLESCAGEFPLFLAPVQVLLLTVTDEALLTCLSIQKKGREMFGIRIEVDKSADRLPKKIRNAEVSRVPLMAIVGKEELECEDDVVSIRTRSGVSLGKVKADLLFSSIVRVMEACNTPDQ